MDESRFGSDLRVAAGQTMGGALKLVTVNSDLDTVFGLDNLAQALWLRLVVAQGDLEHLGHPEYGSRLHLLIGRRLESGAVALAKAYVYEALRRETRVEIQNVSVLPDSLRPGTLLIEVSAKPLGSAETVSVSAALELDPRSPDSPYAP